MMELDWRPEYADTQVFDGCAALSAVVLTPAGATGSTPEHIALFNDGEYLGTATSYPAGQVRAITRLDDGSIRVDYQWRRLRDVATSSGRAQAVYRWDAAAQKVVATGTVPPNDGSDTPFPLG